MFVRIVNGGLVNAHDIVSVTMERLAFEQESFSVVADIRGYGTRILCKGTKEECENYFLEAVFGVWEGVLTEDQMAGFKMKFEEMPQRDKEIISKYYREGRTLKSVGDDYGISRERVRQKIRKIARRFRHPSVAQYIQFGADGAARKEEAEKDERELEIKKAILASREKRIDEATKQIDKKMKEIEDLREICARRESESLDVLFLSARAKTCIRRKGIKTVEELVDLAKAGELMGIRSIGVKTAAEICEKIKRHTGLDFYEENGLVV